MDVEGSGDLAHRFSFIKQTDGDFHLIGPQLRWSAKLDPAFSCSLSAIIGSLPDQGCNRIKVPKVP